jgi:iron(III) transport system substrate-binding protein
MRFSRRDLMVLGMGGVAALVAACGAPAATPTAAPTKPAAQATAPVAATSAPSAAATPPAAGTTAPATIAVATPAATTAAKPAAGTLTVYSGRNKDLIELLLTEFEKATEVKVQPRYGDSAELAAALLEEGKNSPADVFLAQDAGALGAVAARGQLTPLPETLLTRVEERFRSPKGEWVGVSGRARVVVYNTKELKPEDLPDAVAGFTDAKWKDRLGWPPTNASFQAFVTALRLLDGEAAARQWLLDVKTNNPKAYPNNTAIVEAVAKGEIQAGFVNHYYLFAITKGQPQDFSARNYHPRGGGAGSIINVAGAGILTTAKNTEGAKTFIDYLLSTPAQQYFADKTYEYPLISGAKTNPLLTPLTEIKTPNLDLSKLSDLEATLNLLRDTGVL